MTPQIDQEWEVRFPVSGPTALFDRAVGVGVDRTQAFVAGERTTASGNSVFALAKYDLATGTLLDNVAWPPSPTSSAIRMVEKMAIRTSTTTTRTLVAVLGQVPNSGNYDVVTALYLDDTDEATELDLVGTAAFSVITSDPYVHTPVDVAISDDGQVVAVLIRSTSAGKTDYAIAAYHTDDMLPVFAPKLIGASGEWDYPAALTVSDTTIYFAGHSGSSQTGPFEMFVAAVDLDDTGTVLWTKRFGLDGASVEAADIAVQFDGTVGQPIAPTATTNGGLIVVGKATTENGSDMLTVSFEFADGDVIDHDTFGVSGLDEWAVSAAGFWVSGAQATEDIPEGYYVYVTGTGETSSNGTDILTMLYRNTTSGPVRHWDFGARWNNLGINGNEAASEVIVTSTDTVNLNGVTRGLVSGWTTDGSGNKRFVTIKYDAEPETIDNKEPKWSRIEDALTGTYTNKSLGIAHRMLGEDEDERLYFGVAGFSDVGSGSTGSDFWTAWFKEVSEE
jgi:hypothetical protein